MKESKPKKKIDKYQRAINYLKKHPEEIREAWNWPFAHKAGYL